MVSDKKRKNYAIYKIWRITTNLENKESRGYGDIVDLLGIKTPFLSAVEIGKTVSRTDFKDWR